MYNYKAVAVQGGELYWIYMYVYPYIALQACCHVSPPTIMLHCYRQDTAGLQPSRSVLDPGRLIPLKALLRPKAWKSRLPRRKAQETRIGARHGGTFDRQFVGFVEAIPDTVPEESAGFEAFGA